MTTTTRTTTTTAADEDDEPHDTEAAAYAPWRTASTRAG